MNEKSKNHSLKRKLISEFGGTSTGVLDLEEEKKKKTSRKGEYSLHEEASIKVPKEGHFVIFHMEVRSLAESQNGDCVEMMELLNALLACLTVMRTAGQGVQVVGINVEWHKGESIECGRVDDGHVVGCLYAHGGNIRSSTTAHVDSLTAEDALPDGLNELSFVQKLQQEETIPTSDVDCIGFANSLHGIILPVNALNFKAPGSEDVANFLCVLVVVEESVRDEENFRDVVPKRQKFSSKRRREREISTHFLKNSVSASRECWRYSCPWTFDEEIKKRFRLTILLLWNVNTNWMETFMGFLSR
uniref:Uncharacterized protein n=1 Tax=Lutzomyia longipalpis TaxID=7200 RepID=A0A1B0CDZ4_LUTLO